MSDSIQGASFGPGHSSSTEPASGLCPTGEYPSRKQADAACGAYFGRGNWRRRKAAQDVTPEIEGMLRALRSFACTKAVTRYSIELAWSDDDDGFIGRVPELPGCSFFGETRILAMAEADEAIGAWIAANYEAGNNLPAARVNPQPPEWMPRASDERPQGRDLQGLGGDSPASGVAEGEAPDPELSGLAITEAICLDRLKRENAELRRELRQMMDELVHCGDTVSVTTRLRVLTLLSQSTEGGET